MSNKNIKIIQNILKKQDNYDLALKLENAYYEDSMIDGWNGDIGEINLFVDAKYFLEFKNLDDDTLSLLIQIFDGLHHEYYGINSIKFTINTNVEVNDTNDTVYIFVDEAGDMDFSLKGSKYYMFNFLIKQRPFNLHEIISNYRYSLLERNLDPLNGKRLNIEAFHAHNDNKFIKEEMFKLISTFNTKSVQAYSYILEKPKVNPLKRKDKDRFYIDNLTLAIEQLLDKLNIDKNFIIITDNLPVKQNKNKQIGALKKGVKEYIKNYNLSIRYDIFHHCSASSVNLQIVDYISWAVFRKYEMQQDSYLQKVEKYFISIDDMTKDRKIKHYER